VEQAVFIGHDWGGGAVWRMCLWQPKRVRAVAAICTPYRPRTSVYVPLLQMIEKIPVFYYQYYFNQDGGKIAAKELGSNVERTIKCLFRSSKERFPGSFMTKDSSGLLTSYPENPPKSNLLTDEEFQRYVEEYKRTGFLGGLHWYQTGEINWNDEVKYGIGIKIDHPALMVTAGKDFILSPKLTEGMETWIPNLKRSHIEESGHWVSHEQPLLLNNILKDWLNTLNPSLPSAL